jgi:hypothetical protein
LSQDSFNRAKDSGSKPPPGLFSCLGEPLSHALEQLPYTNPVCHFCGQVEAIELAKATTEDPSVTHQLNLLLVSPNQELIKITSLLHEHDNEHWPKAVRLKTGDIMTIVTDDKTKPRKEEDGSYIFRNIDIIPLLPESAIEVFEQRHSTAIRNYANDQAKTIKNNQGGKLTL